MAFTFRECDASELVFVTRDDGSIALEVPNGEKIDAPVRSIVNMGNEPRWDARVSFWIYVWEYEPLVDSINGDSLWVRRIDMTQHKSEEEIKEAMMNCARLRMDTGVLHGYTRK